MDAMPGARELRRSIDTREEPVVDLLHRMDPWFGNRSGVQLGQPRVADACALGDLLKRQVPALRQQLHRRVK